MSLSVADTLTVGPIFLICRIVNSKSTETAESSECSDQDKLVDFYQLIVTYWFIAFMVVRKWAGPGSVGMDVKQLDSYSIGLHPLGQPVVGRK